MVLRLKPFAAIAIAASSVAVARAELVPAVQTPSFSCDAASGGGSINWGDNVGGTPSIGFGLDSSNVTFTQMGCDSKTLKIGDSLLKFDDKQNQLKYFEIKLTDTFISQIDGESLKITDDNSKFLKITDANGEQDLWDVILTVDQVDANGGVINTYKDFVGLKITAPQDSISGASLDSLKLDGAGNFFLDPTIVGTITADNATISLYSTPMTTPEPGTLVMLGTGLLGLGAAVRRRLGW
jgi:PEP-CTERM motif